MARKKTTQSSPSESKNDNEATTYETATSADKHKTTHEEPWDETAKEEEKIELRLYDKESPHGTTNNHGDASSTRLTAINKTINNTVTASSSATSMGSKRWLD